LNVFWSNLLDFTFKTASFLTPFYVCLESDGNSGTTLYKHKTNTNFKLTPNTQPLTI